MPETKESCSRCGRSTSPSDLLVCFDCAELVCGKCAFNHHRQCDSVPQYDDNIIEYCQLLQERTTHMKNRVRDITIETKAILSTLDGISMSGLMIIDVLEKPGSKSVLFQLGQVTAKIQQQASSPQTIWKPSEYCMVLKRFQMTKQKFTAVEAEFKRFSGVRQIINLCHKHLTTGPDEEEIDQYRRNSTSSQLSHTESAITQKASSRLVTKGNGKQRVVTKGKKSKSQTRELTSAYSTNSTSLPMVSPSTTRSSLLKSSTTSLPIEGTKNILTTVRDIQDELHNDDTEHKQQNNEENAYSELQEQHRTIIQTTNEWVEEMEQLLSKVNDADGDFAYADYLFEMKDIMKSGMGQLMEATMKVEEMSRISNQLGSDETQADQSIPPLRLKS